MMPATTLYCYSNSSMPDIIKISSVPLDASCWVDVWGPAASYEFEFAATLPDPAQNQCVLENLLKAYRIAPAGIVIPDGIGIPSTFFQISVVVLRTCFDIVGATYSDFVDGPEEKYPEYPQADEFCSSAGEREMPQTDNLLSVYETSFVDVVFHCFSNPSMPHFLKLVAARSRDPGILEEANKPNSWRPPTPYKHEFHKSVHDPNGKIRKALGILLDRNEQASGMTQTDIFMSTDNALSVQDIRMPVGYLRAYFRLMPETAAIHASRVKVPQHLYSENYGYICCFSNAVMPDILKIYDVGSRSLKMLLNEINSSYKEWGPPHPYKIEFARGVADPDKKIRTALVKLLELYGPARMTAHGFYTISISHARAIFDLIGGT